MDRLNEIEIIDVKLPVGRPTGYEPWMSEHVVGIMAKGAGKEEVCKTLGICLKTFYNWKSLYPEFEKAIELGETYKTAFVVELMRMAMLGKIQINEKAAKLYLDNQVRGFEAARNTGTSTINIGSINSVQALSTEELAKRIKKAYESLPIINSDSEGQEIDESVNDGTSPAS